ncbi:MAG: ribosome-binding factor A, partial [Planctomycetota bacterium]
DPRSLFITITKVELSEDVATGKICYSVLGDEGDRTQVAHMLDGASGFIQRQIASVLKLRNIPHLRWVYDDSIAEAIRMDQVISQALDRDLEIKGDTPDEVAPGAAAESIPESTDDESESQPD